MWNVNVWKYWAGSIVFTNRRISEWGPSYLESTRAVILQCRVLTSGGKCWAGSAAMQPHSCTQTCWCRLTLPWACPFSITPGNCTGTDLSSRQWRKLRNKASKTDSLVKEEEEDRRRKKQRSWEKWEGESNYFLIRYCIESFSFFFSTSIELNSWHHHYVTF